MNEPSDNADRPVPLAFSKTIEIKNHDVAHTRFQSKEFDLFDLAELYHEASKFKAHSLVRAALGTAEFFRPPMNRQAAMTFPGDPTRERVFLPKRLPAQAQSISRVVTTRRSVRSFTGEPVTLAQLSSLLYHSCGVTGRAYQSDGLPIHLRAHASGGGLYPVDAYVLALRVKGLEPGLYFYNVAEHSLELVRRAADVEADAERLWFWGSKGLRAISKGYGFALCLVATFWRSRAKYGLRGYRFALIEAGHLGQNVLLNAHSLGLGCVAHGGYLDDDLHDYLGLDGVDQAVVHTLVVGRAVPKGTTRPLRPGALRNQT